MCVFVTALFIMAKKKKKHQKGNNINMKSSGNVYINFKTFIICEILTKNVLESLLRKREMATILSGKTRIQNVIQFEGDYIILKVQILERNISKC